MDLDIRRIAEKGFLTYLSEMEEANLSDTFWEVGLVQDLETSAINSPFFNVFLAAQVHGNDNSLMMNGTKVRDLITTIGDVHHIFPKKYLQKSGIMDKSKYNQIANYTYLDTATNISVGEKAPNEYFKMLFEQCETKVLKYGNITEQEVLTENLKENCIPENIVSMTVENYDEFLLERRKLMAKKIKEHYYKL